MITLSLDKDGNFVNIIDDLLGRELKCICCNDPLSAKRGKVRTWHFAHKSGVECRYGRETELHLFAKQIIEETRKIVLPIPKIKFNNDFESYNLCYEYTEFDIDSVVLENRLGSIVPDVICKIKDNLFAVEIYVTHKADDEKIAKIRDMKIPTIEIDLSAFKKTILTKQDVADILYLNSYQFKYLWSPKLNNIVVEFMERFQLYSFYEYDKIINRSLMEINQYDNKFKENINNKKTWTSKKPCDTFVSKQQLYDYIKINHAFYPLYGKKWDFDSYAGLKELYISIVKNKKRLSELNSRKHRFNKNL